MILLYVAVGGALGALARYGVAAMLVRPDVDALIPWWTFAVNVVGSFLIGLSIRHLDALASPELRAFWIVGLLGALTTFSTYSFETVELMREGHTTRAAAYALGSLVLGVLAAAAGLALGEAAIR